ncbi:MAG: RNA 2',3'-cyclic phosphodiesterase [Coriobacteriia bacterium]|nr:RNA 2',3'-cyclic phosphodiesterase [Coriobacteriia bacterium]
MRLFISINLDDEVRGDIAAVSDELRRRSAKGTFTLPENLHITLAFLGESDQSQLESAIEVMNAVDCDAFELRLEGIGRFRKHGGGRGDIWWAGVRKSEELLRLQKELTTELRLAGFDLEKRSYKPHVTIGRQIILKDHIDPGGLIGVSVRQPVESIELMQSERIADRLTYTSLYTSTLSF